MYHPTLCREQEPRDTGESSLAQISAFWVTGRIQRIKQRNAHCLKYLSRNHGVPPSATSCPVRVSPMPGPAPGPTTFRDPEPPKQQPADTISKRRKSQETIINCQILGYLRAKLLQDCGMQLEYCGDGLVVDCGKKGATNFFEKNCICHVKVERQKNGTTKFGASTCSR